MGCRLSRPNPTTRTMSRGRDERVKAQVLVPANAASDDATDALWRLSTAKDAQRKREELNALRLQYHTEQADRHRRTLSQLVQFHLREAEKLSKKGSAA